MTTAAYKPKKATKLDRGPELYETPPDAVRALLKAEPGIKTASRIWEPACGRGAIAEELKFNGCSVIATDLNNWGYGGTGRDFLFEESPPRNDVGCIVTNPPYSLAEKFITHGLKLVPTVIYLLRLGILEGVRKDCPAFDNGQLARIYVFRNRLPMMHRDGWEGPKTSNTAAYAWVVFEREHKGPADLHRISWEAK